MLNDYEGQEIDRGIVRFTATWCVPCKRFRPIFDRAAQNLDVDFYAIDIEQYPEIAGEHKVLSIPVVFTVKDGVWTKVQSIPTAAELRDLANDLA
ncbi:MAG: thioredoxin family protein [Actinobacteria bacterium]|nr:thioredoxin family protein [Actinomycetota bacterium]